MTFLLLMLSLLEGSAVHAIGHFEHQPDPGFVPVELRQFDDDALDELEGRSAHKEIAMILRPCPAASS
jgi:hypothetical protein